MNRSGVDRARWLAELAGALEVARAIFADSSPGSERAALAERIAGAISEVEALRLGRNWPTGTTFDPDWTKLRHGRPDRVH